MNLNTIDISPPEVPDSYERETLVRFACECARFLASHLPDRGRDLSNPRSVHVLQEIIADRFPKLVRDIKYLKLSEKAQKVVRGISGSKGSVEIIHGRRSGVIFLADVDNEIERNFALAHELFQRVLDIPALGLPPLRDHVGRVYNYMQSRKWREADISTVQEFLPEIAAVEYLMPYSCRQALLSSRDDLQPIVERFNIPRAFLSLHLSDDFMDYFRAFSGAVGVDHGTL